MHLRRYRSERCKFSIGSKLPNYGNQRVIFKLLHTFLQYIGSWFCTKLSTASYRSMAMAGSLQRGSPRTRIAFQLSESRWAGERTEILHDIPGLSCSFVSILRSRYFYRFARLPMTRWAGGRPRVVVYLRCLPRPFVSPRLRDRLCAPI